MKCYYCDTEIKDESNHGLIISPRYRNQPDEPFDIVNKFHVCGLCFSELLLSMERNIK